MYACMCVIYEGITLYPFYDVWNSQAAKMLGSMLYVR